MAAPDVVGRVRSVIRYAKIRQQMLLDGKEPGARRSARDRPEIERNREKSEEIGGNWLEIKVFEGQRGLSHDSEAGLHARQA